MSKKKAQPKKWGSHLVTTYPCARCAKVRVVTKGGYCRECCNIVMAARERRLAIERSGDEAERIRSGWHPMGNGAFMRMQTQFIESEGY